jgi:hypothetical protein
MANIAKYFIPNDASVIKRTYSVDERDYRLVAKCFDEYGFMQYAPGLIVKVLAQELRAREIEDYLTRIQYVELNSIPRVLDNFPDFWKANTNKLLIKKPHH